jgi:hypothetical protein
MRIGAGLLTLLSLLLAACVRPGPPPDDTTPPQVTLQAMNRAGNPVFQSDETPSPIDACVKFSTFPAAFTLSVGDPGGVRGAVFSLAAGGRIVPESVSVAPPAPESSWTLRRRSDGFAEDLIITLDPPAPGEVRTGLLVTLQVAEQGPIPYAILASGSDASGNRTDLFQVDVRDGQSPVLCRGD